MPSSSRHTFLVLAFVGTSLVPTACSDVSPIPRCTPGAQASCACGSDSNGYQTCNVQGLFDACVCTHGADASVQNDAATASDGAITDSAITDSAITDAGSDANVPDGSTSDGGVDPNCLAGDTDTGTHTFVINALQIPRAAPNSDGLDLDGHGTTKASDLPGCFWVDTKASGSTSVDVDNQLATVNSLAASALNLDISKGLQDAITPPGGAPPSVVLQTVITHWNGSLNDSCVSFDLQVKTGASGFVSAGTAVTRLEGGVTPIFGIANPVQITAGLTGVSSCAAGTYQAGSDGAIACGTVAYDCTSSLPVTIDGVRMRANIASVGAGFRLQTNRPLNGEAGVANPTLLAGHVVYWANDGATRPPCDPGLVPAAGTFQSGLRQAVCDFGQGGLWGVVCGLVSQNLDLRAVAGNVAGGCTTGTNNTNSNANSISVAFFAGSDY